MLNDMFIKDEIKMNNYQFYLKCQFWPVLQKRLQNIAIKCANVESASVPPMLKAEIQTPKRNFFQVQPGHYAYHMLMILAFPNLIMFIAIMLIKLTCTKLGSIIKLTWLHKNNIME